MPLIQDTEDCALEPIAIVGMACRLPGSIDSASALWEALEKKKSAQTPRVPKSRFDIDAYLHDNLERPGSFNVPGGYFLDGPLENFDPTFFGMTPVEAKWLDPQQHKMLEVCYEALESAGKPLDSVSGSNTAVYVGSFTSDYQQMSTREPDFRHNYVATGVDPGIISNRIGNTFNLRGPSFTINTACSSSIYAIHNACHALRARDCDAAITGGVNLILTVDQHMNTAKLGILSPTSTCHTFDASADGYGRAEGVGALYIKRLSDAIRDGDPVRGVIRSSAVNTNGKVPGMGITHPSVKGQELVVRAAYERARLNPNNTAYLECHGTGTPVGDPIEVRAVSNAMNDTRPLDKPLRVGAIKANIGHSEAASGIFAVMKAALMTEKAVIPGVCGLKTLNPAIREAEWNVKVQADTVPWPKDPSGVRRASVSSFGYGGTNGHVIVESVESLYPWYHHGAAKQDAAYEHSTARPLLVTLSAHDKTTLARNIEAHARVAPRYYLADLAHTLNTRRSRFATRAFAVAREGREADDLALSRFSFGTCAGTAASQQKLGFLFTGQGAQWARMGAEAMATFPAFAGTIKALDRVLQRLPEPPSTTLEEALLAPAEASRVHDAEVSQPVCTAVQIAIVDLLAQWQAVPTATAGHSSGEIGAAYAAGLVSAPEAILAAFLRGRAVQQHSPSGAMLAAGLGAVDVAPHLDGIDDIVIACENSPSSVTLSGTQAAVDAVKARLDAAGVFARALRTGRAYHSPQMERVAPHYNRALADAVRQLGPHDAEWRQPRARMFSSVTGKEVLEDTLGAEYWSRNLRSRVRFDDAVKALGTAPELADLTTFVEVGPHKALAGPFRQICQAYGFDRAVHIPTLERNADCAVQLLRTAGALFATGYAVDLEAVNAEPGQGLAGKHSTPSVLVDLPPYQWNYDKVHWSQPRLSAEARTQKYPRHDLLGRKQLGGSENHLAWRNVLRHRDVPWLGDHALGKAAVFPAAGHLSAAIEGLRQISEQKGVEVESVTLRDISIKTALVIPEDEGVEVEIRLTKSTASSPEWYSFAVESLRDGIWTVHSQGKLAANLKKSGATAHPVKPESLPDRVAAKTWYNAFDRVGFEYGPSFQQLATVRTDGKANHAAAAVNILTESGLMDGESRYILHPSTIDACLQLIIISIHAGKHKTMPWGVVPIGIAETTLWFPGAATVNTEGEAVAWTDERDGRHFNTHSKLFTGAGHLLLDVQGLRCVSYEAAIPPSSGLELPPQPYSHEIWKPDIATLTTPAAVELYPGIASTEDTITKTVELLTHKQPVTRVAILAAAPTVLAAALRPLLPEGASIIASPSAEEEEQTEGLIDGQLDLEQAKGSNLDLVVVGKGFADASTLLKSEAALSTTGAIIVWSDAQSGDDAATSVGKSGLRAPSLRFDLPDGTVVLATPRQEPTGHAQQQQPLQVLTTRPSGASASALVDALAAHGVAAAAKDVAEADLTNTPAFVVDDTSGDLLLEPDDAVFAALRAVLTSGAPVAWVTAGVNDATTSGNVGGAMAKGFLRVVRSEHAAARVLLVDVDGVEAATTSPTAAALLAAKLAHAPPPPTKDSGADVEFWLHRGVWHVPRLAPDDERNAEVRADAGLVDAATVLRPGAALQGRPEGAGGTLVFGPRDDDEEDDAKAVSIQVGWAEHDAASSGPTVVVGTRAQAADGSGSGGGSSAAYTWDRLSTVVRVPADAVAPLDGLDGPTAAASLGAVGEAVHALLDTAAVQPGARVVAVEPDARLLRALAGLAAVVGFELRAVAGSAEDKARYEAVAGLAADAVALAGDVFSGAAAAPHVVVAQKVSPAVQELWRSVGAAGKLVVVADGGLDEPLDMAPFARGASVSVSSVRSLAKHRPEALGGLLRRSVDLLKRHGGLLAEADVAVRDVASLAGDVGGRVVVAYDYGKSLVQARKYPARLTFSPQASYLLVGALGGLGRSLAAWMVQRGARHLAFLSRSGADKPEAAAVVASIEQAGATAHVFRADASSEEHVVRAVAELQASGRPIKGVVHAAMVLQDAMFERMTLAQYLAAVRPKVLGARNLDRALQGVELDFFVATSSISATLGNPGQANYAAANSYLDALAAHRVARGQPATSLILPMVREVGVVAESDGSLEASLLRKGMYGIDEAEMLRAFETAMTPRSSSSSSNAQLVLGLEPARLAETAVTESYWYADSRLAGIRATVERLVASSSPSSSSSSAGFAAKLQAAQTPDDAVAAVALHIMERCSGILLRGVDEFDVAGPSIASYGLDSMIGAELRNWLFREFGLDVPFQDLLAPTLSFKELAIKVAAKLGLLGE
ncbi:lovastatin nonaketide synthase [Diplodia corticola]|uniref:Lovastatin nonaketide synthase n=1 Tax=Diplodia corticola TaxID=236234 RepID=A0A1J9RU19_9PEZI|nr:lovastatin nonaketide synthase [Diplodia corticola]OJD31005.1 lovastatin nonaketide synthase [Diplodia corticola]